MGRFRFEKTSENIHLAVEGSVGGTTLGLHMATDVIERGGRVLWASPFMPDGVRFGQLFSHLSLANSAKYHAMNIGGDFDQAVEILIQTSNSLPSVELIVMDDWCERSGRISKDKIDAVQKLAEKTTEEICILLISKGSVDASGQSDSAVIARAKDSMAAAGFEVWRLERPKDGPFRTLTTSSDEHMLRLEEEGFFH
ncbi:hypothetical protein N9M86_02320 [Euryarchaeota archaeon]|nr:hypothetical protein [Euryarchaeota archaeon]MDA9167088.1 hypothetical protein [Candidatus Poseidoniaceae archaeon]MDA8594625.1 hypothetical protein [Euryarchaeota archaeon]MDA8610129.1 hypothetical protein [Euryarchaeota archaeon]MDA8689904.1 hypothetical protein [Euryarchaeota archaeon]